MRITKWQRNLANSRINSYPKFDTLPKTLAAYHALMCLLVRIQVHSFMHSQRLGVGRYFAANVAGLRALHMHLQMLSQDHFVLLPLSRMYSAHLAGSKSKPSNCLPYAANITLHSGRIRMLFLVMRNAMCGPICRSFATHLTYNSESHLMDILDMLCQADAKEDFVAKRTTLFGMPRTDVFVQFNRCDE